MGRTEGFILALEQHAVIAMSQTKTAVFKIGAIFSMLRIDQERSAYYLAFDLEHV
jgi:hypothetical protein